MVNGRTTARQTKRIDNKMDALGDYGSDDGSSASESEHRDANAEITENKSGKTASLSGLLGTYSDPSSDDDDDVKDTSTATKNSSVKLEEKDNVNSCDSAGSPQAKKQRVMNDDVVRTGGKPALPPPHLGSTSIGLWEEDFVSKRREKPNRSGSNGIQISSQLSDKLQRLSSTTASTATSWAEHLKAQREFHNPHFFTSVVEHFGIECALGSQVTSNTVKDFDLDALGLSK